MKDVFFKKAVSIALVVIIVHSLGYFYYRMNRYTYMEGFTKKGVEGVQTKLSEARASLTEARDEMKELATTKKNDKNDKQDKQDILAEIKIAHGSLIKAINRVKDLKKEKSNDDNAEDKAEDKAEDE
jgi:hypothetical protein